MLCLTVHFKLDACSLKKRATMYPFLQKKLTCFHCVQHTSLYMVRTTELHLNQCNENKVDFWQVVYLINILCRQSQLIIALGSTSATSISNSSTTGQKWPLLDTHPCDSDTCRL